MVLWMLALPVVVAEDDVCVRPCPKSPDGRRYQWRRGARAVEQITKHEQLRAPVITSRQAGPLQGADSLASPPVQTANDLPSPSPVVRQMYVGDKPDPSHTRASLCRPRWLIWY